MPGSNWLVSAPDVGNLLSVGRPAIPAHELAVRILSNTPLFSSLDMHKNKVCVNELPDAESSLKEEAQANEHTFGESSVDKLRYLFSTPGDNMTLSNWQLQRPASSTPLTGLWMIVRMELK